MNKKKVLMIILILIFLIILIFYIKNNYKKLPIGNNINKSTESVIEYILNVNSFKAKIEVEINSNKNSSKYELTQQFVSPNIASQVIDKPDDIKGLKIKFDGDNLVLENTSLSLTKVYEKYQYVNNNCLWLNSFIEEYKIGDNSRMSEEENEIVLEVYNKDSIYNYKKKLHIDKKTNKPTKLEVIDNNKKTRIYIIYKEIELNSTNKDEVLAFKLDKSKIEL